ncbi:Uncharacterised protein [Bacteroides eggerthii]|uniref:Uncharacterized protein n=1 Tax=Bacteroides eggerthii TaxID=28111 RepID=A0A380YLF1_9BACE|nr:hypothetical protein [Phocaeicola dorei]SUV29679.1 Uncharacterised protein [Bacteroides eggerthii]
MKMNVETGSMLPPISIEVTILEVRPLENLDGRFSRFGHRFFRFIPIPLLRLNDYG